MGAHQVGVDDLGERCKHRDLRAWALLSDERQRVPPIEARHTDVEHDEIGMQLHAEIEGLLPVDGLSDDVETVVSAEMQLQHEPHVRLVVHK